MEEKYKGVSEYSGVLSIEQMLHLEELGIDTSDASCMWTSIQDKDFNPIKWLPVFRGNTDRVQLDILREQFPLTYKEGNVYYCYTLSDLYRKIGVYEGSKYGGKVCIDKELDDETNDFIRAIGDDEIEATYQMIIKLKERNSL